MIAIKHGKTGEVQYVASLRGYGSDWAQIGPTLPETGDPNLLALVFGAWIEDPAKVEAILLTSIKGEAERRKMLFLSPGGAKKAEYAQKAAEVAFWDSLGGTASAALTALGLLSPSVRQAKFGYALADAAAFSEPNIAAAIERFRVGMTSSTKVPTIAAVEARACSLIKAASTAAAKRAVASAVTWPA